MKRLTFIVTVDCRDDVPPHVLAWMACNLRAHIWNEFSSEYDAKFCDPPYAGPPLDADGTVVVRVGTLAVYDDSAEDPELRQIQALLEEMPAARGEQHRDTDTREA